MDLEDGSMGWMHAMHARDLGSVQSFTLHVALNTTRNGPPQREWNNPWALLSSQSITSHISHISQIWTYSMISFLMYGEGNIENKM